MNENSNQLALTLEPKTCAGVRSSPLGGPQSDRSGHRLPGRTLSGASGVLTSPEATRDYVKLRLDGLGYEVFAMILLDNRHGVLRYLELFRGTLDGASVHPREVVRSVMAHNAAAVIFAHNHPSGITEPSQADIRITQRLKDALALIEVRVLDNSP
jgi:DNA repair protein RadC